VLKSTQSGFLAPGTGNTWASAAREILSNVAKQSNEHFIALSDGVLDKDATSGQEVAHVR
jgi:hypothetical protein